MSEAEEDLIGPQTPEEEEGEGEEAEESAEMVRRRIVASLSFSFVVAFVSILIFGCWFQFGGTQEIIAPVVVDDSEREGPRLFFHVSDFHYDPLADPVLYNSSTSCRSESEVLLFSFFSCSFSFSFVDFFSKQSFFVNVDNVFSFEEN